MTKQKPKTHETAPSLRGDRGRIVWPTLESIKQASAVLNVPEALIKAAKAKGCKAFISGNRVDTDLLDKLQPADLIRYGLIPEFVGRLPVVGTLEDLDRAALIEILTKPKNALVKQYQTLFEYENVRLKFLDTALEAIADKAIERKVGARGLRMVLEDLMLDLMYHLPSQKRVRDILVTKEMVQNQEISIQYFEKAG